MLPPCGVCQNFRSVQPHSRKAPESSLSIKIDSGQFNLNCRYCSVLRQIVLHFAPELGQSQQPWFVYFDLEPGLAANVEVCSESDQKDDIDSYTTITQFFVYLKTPSADLLDLGCLGHHDIQSDGTLCCEFIDSQLADCIQNHPICGSDVAKQLPKRLLQFDLLDGGDVKLIESRDQNSKGIYATLSHCWGDGSPIKTQSKDVTSFQQGIAWARLPPVFQNTIWLCRRLKINLLWIDSLCIIQDSIIDWELESAKMSAYYQNALINIAATESANCMVPFLHERHEKWLPQSFDMLSLDGTSSIQIFARQHAGSSSLQPMEGFGPLTQRAWVFQETVLSNRVLHFTASDLTWECKSNLVSEDGAIPRSLFSMRLTRLLDDLAKTADVYTSWHDIVSRYTTRRLTYPVDRLPALSGIASRVQSLVQTDYLAGLWRANLINDLCWSVDAESSSAPGTLAFANNTYISPTWAWPSVSEQVTFEAESPTCLFTPLAEVKDAQCVLSGSNTYGRIASGHLQLCGHVQHITIRVGDPKERYTYVIGDDPGLAEPFFADTVLTMSNGVVRRAVHTDVLGPISVSVPCMLIGKFEDEEEQTYYILVLSELENGEYCRIGFAVLSDEVWLQHTSETTIHII